MSAPLRLFAACAPGLEPLLAAELEALGALAPEPIPGGVRFRGHRRVLYRANLESGLASHILVRIARFDARALEDVRRESCGIPWERWLAPNVARRLKVSVHRSRLTHRGAIAERLEDGIREHLREAGTPTEDDSPVPVHLRLDRDHATVSIDSSGEPLHRRGHRLATAKAPLRPDVARALLIASGWDRETPLIDPFCGAGTILIEAAELARHLPSGRDRRFAFERTPLLDSADLARVREAALGRARPAAPSAIRGGDRDAGAIEATRANAERAGVLADLELGVESVSGIALADLAAHPRGALVTNPPWGARLGSGDLRPLYQTLRRRIDELPAGWRFALLAEDPRLSGQVAPGVEPTFVTDLGGKKIHAVVGGASAPRSSDDG